MSETTSRGIMSLARRGRRGRWWWRAVLALAVVVGGGALALLLAPRRPPPPPPLRPRDLYAPGHWRAHPELCPERGARLRLLIMVASAPTRSAHRMAVRLTWGHYTLRRDVAVAFVLGAPATLEETLALAAEDDLYGDLVVGNTVHAARHTTLRSISMLEWSARYCSEVRHLLKTDDDMFLNVPRLLAFTSGAAVSNASRTVWGRVVRKSLPKRTLRSKYFVSAREWAGGVYPDFTTGPAYLMTGDCVRPLLAAAGAPLRRYLRLEDVFVTGVLAAELGIRRVHAPPFYNRKLAPHPCAIQRTAAVHMVRYHEQFDFWRKLLDPRLSRLCNITDIATSSLSLLPKQFSYLKILNGP